MGATANPPKSDDRYAQLTRGVFIKNHFLQNPHFSHLTLISVKEFKTKPHRYKKIHTFFTKFSKLNDRHCASSLFWPFKSTICPIVKRVRTKRTPASSYFFSFFITIEVSIRWAGTKLFWSNSLFHIKEQLYTTSKVVPFSLLSTQAQYIHQDSKLLLNRFNPIPTACCHMTLIYGLIPPMAGRNRVKLISWRIFLNKIDTI